jgi:hypothetical protein
MANCKRRACASPALSNCPSYSPPPRCFGLPLTLPRQPQITSEVESRDGTHRDWERNKTLVTLLTTGSTDKIRVTSSDVRKRRYPATQLRPDLRCQISASSGGVDNASRVPCFPKQTTDKARLTGLDLPRIPDFGPPLSTNQRQ